MTDKVQMYCLCVIWREELRLGELNKKPVTVGEMKIRKVRLPAERGRKGKDL